MEKLIVENFVSIRKVEIKLNKINILIGPQAAGKSLLAKLIAFIKDIHDKLINEIICTFVIVDNTIN
ncbi:AAA family ATPase [Xenorhabdus bovienii]|uniref:AAA family ATPase n=1 Tax=Xenorhabdus bovienii TaxID=40576 RepID=UPI0023B26381|nr:AAA family ATPase [Xenorhabdus bovienii]MDE9519901.1 AAA family ATPase [Xenorhabdus bovienii]